MTSKSNSKAPTLRSLAKLAGVTAMTVSLALRNNPRIPLATRRRLQKLAAEQGYRPDPAVSKLMHHLRTKRHLRLQAILCGLRSRSTGDESRYGDLIAAGARRRAESLGYAFETVWIDDAGFDRRRIQGLLRSRGVEGIVLLPMVSPISIPKLLIWDQFSVVTATLSVLAPHFHGVIPDQFGNMMKLCSHLTQLGLNRIGLVTLSGHDLRVDHRFTGALAWHRVHGKIEPVVPYISHVWPPSKRELTKWLARAKPNVIVGDSENCLTVVRTALSDRLPAGFPLYCTGLRSEESAYPGINEYPEEIGSAAIEILSGLLQHGVKGIPATPHLTMLEGRLVEKGRPRF
jgi:LacI family transcriptional regulator